MGGIIRILEKAEEQLCVWSNLLNLLAAGGVIKKNLVPDGDDMGPGLALLLG